MLNMPQCTKRNSSVMDHMHSIAHHNISLSALIYPHSDRPVSEPAYAMGSENNIAR
jgi:hypothetical protein